MHASHMAGEYPPQKITGILNSTVPVVPAVGGRKYKHKRAKKNQKRPMGWKRRHACLSVS